ncbi:MAG: sigma-70 family RNA polymerase sigma factor [Oscillospiraceae bacterium]|nr:sigma-70 family RNA polymerase sigma factor [Oscillospiraceae bacterium]
MLSDDADILLLQKRDEEGIRQIRQKYGKQSYALAYRILGRHEDAEECVSDVLLEIWNSIPPKEPQSLRAYLITLTRCKAIDRLKAEKALKRGGNCFAQTLDELAEVLPSADRVESEVEQRELNRALKAFLDQLKPETRHIFMQRYYFSMPVQEIADQNGMKPSAVKMSLLRTREKLKAFFEKEGLQ